MSVYALVSFNGGFAQSLLDNSKWLANLSSLLRNESLEDITARKELYTVLLDCLIIVLQVYPALILDPRRDTVRGVCDLGLATEEERTSVTIMQSFKGISSVASKLLSLKVADEDPDTIRLCNQITDVYDQFVDINRQRHPPIPILSLTKAERWSTFVKSEIVKTSGKAKLCELLPIYDIDWTDRFHPHRPRLQTRVRETQRQSVTHSQLYYK